MELAAVAVLLLLLAYNTQSVEEPGVACVDHSDCVTLGYRYSCVVYRCTDRYSVRTGGCTTDQDCTEDTNTEQCHSGLCLPSSELMPCQTQSHCPGADMGCCGGWCCPELYARQWQNFSCISDSQCRDWLTGDYCCSNNRCCYGIEEEVEVNCIDDISDQDVTTKLNESKLHLVISGDDMKPQDTDSVAETQRKKNHLPSISRSLVSSCCQDRKVDGVMIGLSVYYFVMYYLSILIK